MTRGPWNEFCRQLGERWEQGAREYGDQSFRRDGAELMQEILEELVDVVGWHFVLWARVRAKESGEVCVDAEQRDQLQQEFLVDVQRAIARVGPPPRALHYTGADCRAQIAWSCAAAFRQWEVMGDRLGKICSWLASSGRPPEPTRGRRGGFTD